MNVKYQIFISSTYTDLKVERDQVIKATLEMGHIPVGMEMFSAADEEQWKIITRQIDQSDYYVVIIAHRYGSVIDGISYTEKEYDYAVQQGVPVLGFIIDSAASWPADRVDTDSAKKSALDAFKEKVKKKPVGFWTTTEDLHGKFSIALMKLINTNPRPGWARATEVVGPEVMTELSRLSSENAQLRKQLESAAAKAKEDITAQRSKVLQSLDTNKINVKIWYENATDWSKPIESTLRTLFDMLAPELMIEKSVKDISSYIGTMFRSPRGRALRAAWPVPSNKVKQWLADLMIFGLVAPSTRKHPSTDQNEYWTLTEEGRQIYAMFRKFALEQEAQPDSPETVQGGNSEQDSIAQPAPKARNRRKLKQD